MPKQFFAELVRVLVSPCSPRTTIRLYFSPLVYERNFAFLYLCRNVAGTSTQKTKTCTKDVLGMPQQLAWIRASHPSGTEKPRTSSVSAPSAASATEVHCEVQKHSDKEEEENEGQTRGSLLETHQIPESSVQRNWPRLCSAARNGGAREPFMFLVSPSEKITARRVIHIASSSLAA